MNTAEAQAWAAGLFLADGTVGIYENRTHGKVYHRVSFALRMRDYEVVERYHEIIENPRSLRKYKAYNKRGEYWMWSSENTQCDFVLATGRWMIPLLVGRKQRQFEIVVQLCEDIRRHKGGHAIPDEALERRQQLYKAYLRAGAETERFDTER